MNGPVPSHAFAHEPTMLKLGDREVRRLGFGAMRLPGKDVWGPPADVENARRVVRRAIDLGVQFIDTSGTMGPTCPTPSSPKPSIPILPM